MQENLYSIKQRKNKTRYFSIDSRYTYKSTIQRLPHIGQKSLDFSESSEFTGKCLNLLQDIEKLCDSYEQLPIIEFEDDEKEEFASKIVENEKEESQKDTKLNYIIMQLKKRIKNYPNVQAAYPSSNRFKVFSGTEEKVGPGSYKSGKTIRLEGHEFSKIPRLFTPIAHTMHTIESLYKNHKEIVEDKIIRKNKLLSINPNTVKEQLAIKNQSLKLKEKDVKLKKEIIDLKTIFDKKEKLKEKIRKFE